MSNSIYRQAKRATIMAGQHVPNPLPKLKNAMVTLRNNGITIDQINLDRSPLMPIAEELEGIKGGEMTKDIANVIFTLMQAENFNRAVRENTLKEGTGEEYLEIAQDFQTIHSDMARMVSQAERGKISLPEKMGNTWMRVRRGDIQERYENIVTTLTDVQVKSQKKLHATRNIMGAFEEYRIAVKEATMVAEKIRDAARADMEEAGKDLNDIVSELQDENAEHRNELEMLRDENARAFRATDRRFQFATDLYQNLEIAYHTGNAVMARTAQIGQALDRIWSQSVSFLATNSGTLTTLQVAFDALKATNSMTRAHQAMKKGLNQQILDLAETGTKIQTAAIREGYAPNIEADTLKKLMDSIVQYSQDVVGIINEERDRAEVNHGRIRQIAEDGGQQIAAANLQASTAISRHALEQADRRPQLEATGTGLDENPDMDHLEHSADPLYTFTDELNAEYVGDAQATSTMFTTGGTAEKAETGGTARLTGQQDTEEDPTGLHTDEPGIHAASSAQVTPARKEPALRPRAPRRNKRIVKRTSGDE